MSFGPLSKQQQLFINNIDLSGKVSTNDAFHAAMFPEDRVFVDIHHIAPPKKKADRSGRPGGARFEAAVRLVRANHLAENASVAISSLNEEIKVVGATVMAIRGVVDEMKDRSDAMWKLLGPLASNAVLLTAKDGHQLADSIKLDIHKEMEELLGGVEMRLQEVEEDLYGNA